MRRAALLILGLSVGACTITPGSGSQRDRYYLGLVRVAHPKVHGDLLALDVMTLGGGAGRDGAFLGYRRGRFVYVKPGECQLVVMARTDAQIDHIRSMLTAMGDDICLVKGQLD